MYLSTCSRLLATTLLLLGLAGCGGSGSSGGGLAPGDQLGVAPTETLVVTNLDDSGPGSLRQAIEDAIPGAWIVFDPGLPSGEINLLSVLEIDKALAIGGLAGDGARMRIDAGNATGIFSVLPGAHLWINQLRMVNGNVTSGGAINAMQAQVTVLGSHFGGNTGGFGAGGAIGAHQSQVTIFDTSFSQNEAEESGAIAVHESVLRIERSSFFMNTAFAGNAGAVSARNGATTIVNTSFLENFALGGGSSGGGLHAYTLGGGDVMSVRIYSSTFAGNTAGNRGGGVHLDAAAGSTIELEVYRSIIAENTAGIDDPDFEGTGGITLTSQQNLIGVGDNALFWNGIDQNAVGSLATPVDPMLGPPIAEFAGRMMRIPEVASPANAAVVGPVLGPEGVHLFLDMRGAPREPGLGNELGAIERL